MKYIVLLALLSLTSVGIAQSVNNNVDGVQFFSQVIMADDISSSELGDIQQDLNQNPNVQMARVDQMNKTIFVVTQPLDSFERESFESWIGANASLVNCYRQGVQGVDDFIPFDDNFCTNSE
ncbi:MAG: hypothetical protein COA32_03325 [Fluviicola sp.]|nr:MAG: hypothetical protein COA32_03325 [Fluviicola sp.]